MAFYLHLKPNDLEAAPSSRSLCSRRITKEYDLQLLVIFMVCSLRSNWRVENIRRARVLFLPGGDIRRACRQIRLKGINMLRPGEQQGGTPSVPDSPEGGGEQGSGGGGL